MLYVVILFKDSQIMDWECGLLDYNLWLWSLKIIPGVSALIRAGLCSQALTLSLTASGTRIQNKGVNWVRPWRKNVLFTLLNDKIRLVPPTITVIQSLIAQADLLVLLFAFNHSLFLSEIASREKNPDKQFR